MRLDAQNLGSLARGCALLGAGGGGDPELGLIMALTAVDQHGPVDVVALEDLADDALIMPCGLVGSPAIASEKIWGGDEGRILRNAVERLRTEPVAALMCYSLGAPTGCCPSCGRPASASPRRRRRHGARVSRTAAAGHAPGRRPGEPRRRHGRARQRAGALLRERRLGRADGAQRGGLLRRSVRRCAVLHDGPHGARAAISGSLSRAVGIGEALSADAVSERIDALCDLHDAVVVIEGSVIHVERRADDGFVRGSATIREAASGARQLRLELQNEFLLAIEDGAVRAAVPDLISVLSADTGSPIATERLRRGERVVVVATPAPDLWLSPAGLSVAGPATFGYDVDYAPMVGGATDARR